MCIRDSALTYPDRWFGKKYQDIIEMRSLVIRSKSSQTIKAKNHFIEENQLISMAKRPTDIEMNFKNKPTYKMSFSDINEPMGPSASLERMKITQNVKVDPQIDYIISDDLKSVDQIKLLYQKTNIYQIMNILSSGSLGKEDSQKMVPTRWGITAIDDILAKSMMERIRNYKQIEAYVIFESKYLGNNFVILLMPGNWEYENFEAWAPGSTWSQGADDVQILEEYEPYSGRTSYAKLEAGGYYAARLGVCEAMDRMKRQARVIVFREISEGYVIPIGVWQVRENSRNSFKNEARAFSTLTEALDYISTRLTIPISRYKEQSIILRQKRLLDF